MEHDATAFTAFDGVETIYRSPAVDKEPTPVVSIIVPFYNDVRWIEEMMIHLGRIQAPIGGAELILVDDGSLDETQQLLAALAPGLPGQVTLLQLKQNRGRSVARNVGIHRARGEVIAFTDSDCLPTPDWLRAALPHFSDAAIGIVQGQTLPERGVSPSFFSHFMEVTHEDGHYATCNVFYRRSALMQTGGFDVEMGRTASLLGVWEDVDMGWRVRGEGWQSVFESKATVYHRVIPISPMRWLTWALHLGRRPDIASRYPEYRRFLFRRYWIHPHHLWLTAALLGTIAAILVPPALLLWIPYLILMGRRFGLSGRWPLLKWGLHIGWDLLGFGALLWRSLKVRELVL